MAVGESTLCWAGGGGGIAHVQALLRCPVIFTEAEDALSVARRGAGIIVVVVRFS